MANIKTGGLQVVRYLLLGLAIAALAAAAVLGYRYLTRRQFGRETVTAERVVALREGELSVRETSLWRNDGKAELHRRSYHLPNGDTVISGRMQSAGEDCDYTRLEQWTLPTADGTVTWYDKEQGVWQSAPLGEQEIASNCVMIDTAQTDMYFWRPITYEVVAEGSLREGVSYGWVEIGSDGRTVKLFSSYLYPGEVCDYTVVCSNAEGLLLDLGYKSLRTIWMNYTQNGDGGRWCYDGYYYPAPEDYVPTDCLYRLPAAYLISSMVGLQKECRAADDLSLMMFDTMTLLQNEAGYVSTPSLSLWLNEDYGLDAGFFDTRFNSNLITLFCKNWANHGGFEPFLQRWADWFCAFAEHRHFETEHGGWLVWDYGDASLTTPATHTSLNHQLAEIITLLQLDEILDDDRLRPLCERMLLGVEDCGERWLREDGNLHYAYYPDDGFGGHDYPYLTYNDMKHIQPMLEQAGLGRSALLDTLMDAKRAWMDSHGVTGYEK